MRTEWQQWENRFLAPWAAHSDISRGRQSPETECQIRTVWQRDRDRIIHCKAFRRLKHKTQVFINPDDDHFRTRLTHTLEVAQISRTIARALSLNEDLTEAIAMGHDLGHAPFGHIGERALAAVCPGFTHARQSLRVVDLLEQGGRGLNLTQETRDGILHHSGDGLPQTLEGCLVRHCDRIAYLNHDIDDAIRSGYLSFQQLPESTRRHLGKTHSTRINTMVMDIIDHSAGRPEIIVSPMLAEIMEELRDFMFAQFYYHPDRLAEEERLKSIINYFHGFYLEHQSELPAEYCREPYSQSICDYIAGMTDNYALAHYRQLLAT